MYALVRSVGLTFVSYVSFALSSVGRAFSGCPALNCSTASISVPSNELDLNDLGNT